LRSPDEGLSSPDIYIPIFSARLTQFQWPDQPINRVPETTFHDFAGLQITLKVAVCTTTVQLSALKPGLIEIPSLSEGFASCIGTELGFLDYQYRYDDPSEAEKLPTTVVLALLVEDFQMPQLHRQWMHHCAGLTLRRQTEDDTWKRTGHWNLGAYDYHDPPKFDISISADATEDTQAAYTSEDVLEADAKTGSSGPSKESMFLRMKGAKMETLTLI
jgi:hypothetical protein